MTYRLLIKTHKKTGIRYLCKTERENWDEYPGSGTHWRRHLRKNGRDISTELLFETEDRNEFRQVAKSYSIQFDVINSQDWANLVHEEGDGGDTVSGYTWVTDGIEDRYIRPGGDIPDGWEPGRSNCVFNDRSRQSEFSKKVDRTSPEYKDAMKYATQKMLANRDHSKCGTKGDANPTKRPEVREKIRLSALNRQSKWCDQCQKHFKALEVHIKRSRAHNG